MSSYQQLKVVIMLGILAVGCAILFLMVLPFFGFVARAVGESDAIGNLKAMAAADARKLTGKADAAERTKLACAEELALGIEAKVHPDHKPLPETVESSIDKAGHVHVAFDYTFQRPNGTTVQVRKRLEFDPALQECLSNSDKVLRTLK